MANAIRERQELGLRHDLAWVLAVAEDPAAVHHWGFPLLPAEDQALMNRGAAFGAPVLIVNDYARDHRDVFGGLYLDNRNVQLVTLWTDDPDVHLAALRELVGSSVAMDARQVRWSERELDRVRRAIGRDWDWFGRIDAEPTALGVRTIANGVGIEISSANPDAPRLIAEHYARTLGVPPEMIQVESDGTGVELMPEGRIEVRVVTADGERPGHNDLIVDLTPDVAGTYGQPMLAYGVARSGRIDFIATVGWWTAVAKLDDPSNWDPGIPVSQPQRLRVKAGQTTELTVVLDAGVEVRLPDR